MLYTRTADIFKHFKNYFSALVSKYMNPRRNIIYQNSSYSFLYLFKKGFLKIYQLLYTQNVVNPLNLFEGTPASFIPLEALAFTHVYST